MKLSPDQITAVVLSGGQSKRMGGIDKGLLRLWGTPLVGHVIARLVPQIGNILLSVNDHHAAYGEFGYRLISESPALFTGPLAGIAKAISEAQTPWVLSVPCDNPFLPSTYVERMCAEVEPDIPNVVSIHGQWQPTFSLWPVSILPRLEQAQRNGERSAKAFLQSQHARAIDFSDLEPCFLNINTREQLDHFNSVKPALFTPQCPVVGIVGYSGSGKTSLLKAMLPLLRESGLRVGIIKHAHHQFDVDTPGKDSYELRQAGGNPVLITSQHRSALMTETPQHTDPSLAIALQQMCAHSLDLILVEGFKHAAFPKIEVHRPSLGKPLLCQDDGAIIAVATDIPETYGITVPVLDLNLPQQVTHFLLTYIKFLKTTFTMSPPS